MPLLQGLIFDLDGTLLNSAPDLRHALNRTLEDHGRRPLDVQEVEAMIGDGGMTLVSRAFAATGDPLSEADAYSRSQQLIEYYRNLPADPEQMYPHTLETLKQFHGAGVKLGICTNKPETATHHLLEALDLKRYFTFIAGFDTFPVHKPHPGHVAGVIKGLGVPAAHCVMIGDGPHDVTSARGAGIPCLVVTHGYGGDFGNYGGSGLISGFRELVPALKNLGFEINR